MNKDIQIPTAKPNPIPLRAHHLFCTALFQGKGYNKLFTEEMTSVIHRLNRPDTELILLSEPDNICLHCPNLKPDGKCALDKEKTAIPAENQNGDIIPAEKTDTGNKNTIISDIENTDKFILQYFNLPAKKPVSKTRVYQRLKDTLTKEFFEQCCHDCRWYKQGLCSYEQLTEALLPKNKH